MLGFFDRKNITSSLTFVVCFNVKVNVFYFIPFNFGKRSFFNSGLDFLSTSAASLGLYIAL